MGVIYDIICSFITSEYGLNLSHFYIQVYFYMREIDVKWKEVIYYG